MGPRNPRRSACDLCRAYKLRCDRDDRHGKSCDRCTKANQACTITLDPPPPSRPPPNSTREREQHRPNAVTAVAHAAAAPANPTAANSWPGIARLQQLPALRTLYPSTPAELPPPTSMAERKASGDGNFNYSYFTDYSSMDFSMPIASFDSGDSGGSSYLFPDTPLDAGNVATPEMTDAGSFDPRSTAVPATSAGPEPWKLLHGSGHVSQTTFQSEPPRSMEEHELPAADSKNLTQLSLEILDDYERLRASSPLKGQPETVPHHCTSAEQHRPFNRLLDQASRLSDIITNMCPAAEGETGKGLQPDWTEQSPFQPPMANRPDQVLIMTLITTYAYLMRNCRAIFMRLLLGLQSEASAKLMLPHLQFGTFKVNNSLPIQVKVLIDITSSVLQLITNALGIGSVGISPGTPPTSAQDDPGPRLPFLADPVYVSLRDTILSQELNLPENEQNMSLQGIMVDIQRLVDQKFK